MIQKSRLRLLHDCLHIRTSIIGVKPLILCVSSRCNARGGIISKGQGSARLSVLVTLLFLSHLPPLIFLFLSDHLLVLQRHSGLAQVHRQGSSSTKQYDSDSLGIPQAER